MMDGGANVGGVITVVASAGLVTLLTAVLVVMLLRLRHEGTLATVLVHVVFLPERRRRVLGLIVALAVFFILAGCDAALTSLAVLNGTVQSLANAVVFGGGALALLLLMLVALRPPAIDPARRAELRRASEEFLLLAFAPAEVHDGLGAPPP